MELVKETMPEMPSRKGQPTGKSVKIKRTSGLEVYERSQKVNEDGAVGAVSWIRLASRDQIQVLVASRVSKAPAQPE